MISCIETRLGINQNVYVERLYDGTHYLAIRTRKDLIPLFLKESIIEVVNYINENECTQEELEEVYGSEIEQIIESLKELNIVCDFEKREKELEIQGDFTKWKSILHTKAYNSRTPLLAKMEMTYNCNYKCKFCYIDGLKEKWLPVESVKRIFDQLKEAGVAELYITGGEPFLHPNILEIIDYAYNQRFILTVQTNASFLTDDMITQLKKYKNIAYGISFHSSIPEVFDAFTQVKGSFQKTMDAGRRLQENNMPFFYKYTVTTENEEHMKEDINFLQSTGYEYQVGIQLLPSIDDSHDNSKFTASLENMDWLYKHKYIPFSRTTCTAFKTKLWISSKGDVYPCELVRKKMGNLIQDDFDSIWFGDSSKDVLESNIYMEPEQCANCANNDYCNKCMAYTNYENWDGELKFFCDRTAIVKKYYEL